MSYIWVLGAKPGSSEELQVLLVAELSFYPNIILVLKTGSCWVVQAGLKLMILLFYYSFVCVSLCVHIHFCAWYWELSLGLIHAWHILVAELYPKPNWRISKMQNRDIFDYSVFLIGYSFSEEDWITDNRSFNQKFNLLEN